MPYSKQLLLAVFPLAKGWFTVNATLPPLSPSPHLSLPLPTSLSLSPPPHLSTPPRLSLPPFSCVRLSPELRG